MRVLRDGGTALYQVTLKSWRIIEVVRSSTNLGVTATEFTFPKKLGLSAQRRTPIFPNRQRTTSYNLVSLRYEKSFPPSTPSWFILTSSRLLDNILPRTSGFTGVRDVTSSRRILLNKQEDERSRLAYYRFGPFDCQSEVSSFVPCGARARRRRACIVLCDRCGQRVPVHADKEAQRRTE